MSSAPKRMHEEDGHPTTSKHTPEDTSAFHNNLSGKLAQIVATEYHPPPFHPGSDGRPAKVARTEPRESDKRLPLHPMYRMPLSSNESGLDHLANSENRLELRDTKENRDAKIENRDAEVESRELYTEARSDPQCAKGEKTVRSESRTDDNNNNNNNNNNNKESKHDREPHMEYKGEIKAEKDGSAAGNGHLTWKEPKEHQRGKSYPETSEGLDLWRISRSSSHVPTEIGKEVTTTEGRECLEAHEAVGENKVDLKDDDKLKDMEKKRKDEKHKDWGERGKDRPDHRDIMPLGNSRSERRESTREERESERWEKERKGLQKEKERSREREKDHIKKEGLKGFDKEGSQNERELVDVSVRMPETENPALEQRRHKESDGLRSVDRDSKDRKREKDVDVDVDRREKQSRCSEKEPDEGCMEGDGGTAREREGLRYGVQQRKRMIRPRGSPQMTNREPRFRSRSRDIEESQDKPEVSTIVYKVGECMQELMKSWKEFSASQDNKNDETSSGGPTLEVRIPAEYVTDTNRQVKGNQLWGTDIYTDDSDLVAVLIHTSYCQPTSSPPPPAIHELRVTIRVLPPQECYISTLRNKVRSRIWGAAIGCSYRVERCCIVKKGGGTIDLEPCPTHTSSVEPTLAPVAVERTMTTRAAASNALRQQRFVQELTIQYNLCNEPWIKYGINIVADKGLKKPLYTSARLKKGEVLYLETHSTRYELCFDREKTVSALTTSQVQETEKEKLQLNNSHDQNGERSHLDRDTIVDVFRWSRCKKPLPQKVMHSIGIPLPREHLEVLEENLDWDDVQWSQTGVWIAGKEYKLARVHFLSPN